MCSIFFQVMMDTGGGGPGAVSAHPTLVGRIQLLLKSSKLNTSLQPFPNVEKSVHHAEGAVHAEAFVSCKFIFAVGRIRLLRTIRIFFFFFFLFKATLVAYGSSQARG